MATMMRPYAIAPAAVAGGQEGVAGLKKGGRKVETNKRGSAAVVEIEDKVEEGGEEGWEEEGEKKGGKKPKANQTAKELCGANAMSDSAGEGRGKRKLDRDEEGRASKKKLNGGKEEGKRGNG